MTEEIKSNSFKNFTNLYEVQKTLRFELRPEQKTKELIENNKVREKDKLIDDNYHKIKYYFDLLHQKFINETLQDTILEINEYYRCFELLNTDNNESREKFYKEEEKLRKEIVDKFNKKADDWKKKKYINIELKKNGIGILFEKENLKFLKKEFSKKPSDKNAPDIIFIEPLGNREINLFDSFQGFHTYFTNFNRSRKNFYSEEGKDTAIANRVINENLRRFCENRKQFLKQKEIYKKIELTEDEMKIFELNYYNGCLTQEGIENYNDLLGGKVKENGEKIQGINEKINLYRQEAKERILVFKELYNQILGKKKKASEFSEIINDPQVFNILKKFMVLNDEKIKQSKELFLNFIEHQNDYDISKIYLKREAVNTISRKFFGDKYEYFENALPHKKTSSSEEKYKLDDFISIQQIKDALCGKQLELPKKWRYLSKIESEPINIFKETHKDILISDNTEANYGSFLNIWKNEFNFSYKQYEDYRRAIKEMMDSEKNYNKNESQIEKIKNYSDATLKLYQMMKYFVLEKAKKKILPENGSDTLFYDNFDKYYQDYDIIAYYNEFRNYITKKDFLGRLLFPVFGNEERQMRYPSSKRSIDGAEKIKLNFDISHDHDYGNLFVLFRDKSKKDTYLVGIPVKSKSGLRKIIEKIQKHTGNASSFEMMKYKQLKFKTLVGKGYKSKFGGKYIDHEDKTAIKNTKILVEKYLEEYPLLENILNKEYSSKREFGADVEEWLNKSYCLEFISVDEAYIRQLEEDGNIYLFQINTKDFHAGSRGKSNIQTEYFRLLFENEKFIKLNSVIELFFRPKIENSKYKRYQEDKIFLHISIILNFGKKKIYCKFFNERINNFLVNTPNINIIGIDRGENNLAYYSVINQEGTIIETGSLNDPLQNKDYNNLLEKKAGNREEARKNWQIIGNIKELKNGYISQVVRRICDLVLKYNAIVVFEDLNIGFKRSRQKIEKSVYQKLELALAKKLNYLVVKNTIKDNAGHYLMAYQLTPPINTFSDIKKQCGIIFYTTASYTSITCPQCGFRKNVRFIFENKEKAKEKIKKLKIYFESEKKRFRIEYNLDTFQFNEEKKDSQKNELFSDVKENKDFVIYSDIQKIRWCIKDINNSDGETIIKKLNKGFLKKYDINACLMSIFKDKIDISKNNISDQIAEGNFDAKFYKDIFYYLDILLFVRNTIYKNNSNPAIDLIQCPSCHFDSSKGFQNGIEFNGDANGAYNIARKGILILKKIHQFQKHNNDLSKLQHEHLLVRVKEWDKFTQTQWNPIFKSQK